MSKTAFLFFSSEGGFAVSELWTAIHKKTPPWKIFKNVTTLCTLPQQKKIFYIKLQKYKKQLILNVLLYQAPKAHREFSYGPTSALDGVGGKRHVHTRCTEGWMVLGTGLDRYRKTQHHQVSNPEPFSQKQVSIPNTLSRPIKLWQIFQTQFPYT